MRISDKELLNQKQFEQKLLTTDLSELISYTLYKYSDNQKTMEQEDELKQYFRIFDVIKKQIVLLDT